MRKIKRGRRSGYAVWKKRAWLEQKYLDEGLSIAEMAKEAGVEVPTIVYWMKKHDVKTRSIAEAKLGSHHSDETKQKISASQKRNAEEKSNDGEDDFLKNIPIRENQGRGKLTRRYKSGRGRLGL